MMILVYLMTTSKYTEFIAWNKKLDGASTMSPKTLRPKQ